jgi:hypothetical protein
VSVLRTILSRVALPFQRLGRGIAQHWRLTAVLVPIAVLALALAGYGWWWRYLADRVRENAGQMQAAQTALGRNLEWNSFEITGFPYLVDVTLSKARLMAPDLGTAWDGEKVNVRIRPFSLNRIAVSLEGNQHVFYVGDGRWIEADAEADKALLRAANKDGVQQISADIERLTGKGKLDASDFNFILESATLGAALTPADSASPLPRLDVVAHATNLGLQGNIDFALGPAIEKFDIDVGVQVPPKLPINNADALWAAWRATHTPIDIRQFAFEWGGVSVAASGSLTFDDMQRPEGRLKLTLGNHSRILELLESGGWITKETHAAAKPVLDVLAFVSGDPRRRITVPLRFESGEVYLGPARIMTMKPVQAPAIPEFVP